MCDGVLLITWDTTSFDICILLAQKVGGDSRGHNKTGLNYDSLIDFSAN